LKGRGNSSEKKGRKWKIKSCLTLSPDSKERGGAKEKVVEKVYRVAGKKKVSSGKIDRRSPLDRGIFGGTRKPGLKNQPKEGP